MLTTIFGQMTIIAWLKRGNFGRGATLWAAMRPGSGMHPAGGVGESGFTRP
jgi:hypothetical protein